jgi:hypothetical protein
LGRGISAGQFAGLLANLQSFVDLALIHSIVTRIPDFELVDNDETEPLIRSMAAAREREGNWRPYLERASAEGFPVSRINYASPLEVWFEVARNVGLSAGVGTSMVFLFNRVQRARVFKARADVEVAALNILRSQLENYSSVASADERVELAVNLARTVSLVPILDSVTDEVPEAGEDPSPRPS